MTPHPVSDPVWFDIDALVLTIDQIMTGTTDEELALWRSGEQAALWADRTRRILEWVEKKQHQDRTGPTPTTPHFQVGDRVIAPNGEPRIVLGMKWTYGLPNADEWEKIPEWGWCIRTAHPDEPTKYIGQGFEDGYCKA